MRGSLLIAPFAPLWFFALVAQGQQPDASMALEPELPGVIYVLDAQTKSLKALPKEQYKVAGKSSGVFSGAATGSVQISQVTSSFRLKRSDTLEFVFKVNNPTEVKLFSCSSDHKKALRQFVVAEVQKGGRIRESLPGLPVEFAKYGNAFKLTAKSLPPGEYAIVAGGVYSFGID